MYFDSISRDKLGERDNCILLIRKPLLHVLRQLLIYLDAGLLCRHMHILKQQEIILVLRGFYTKPELASFFSGTSGVGRKFEDFVLENYRKVKSVKEFASLCCVSERSFNRKFQDCFNQSPYQWMQERKAEIVREKVCDPDVAFREIAMEFGFSSPAHLTCYCKRLFGLTPTELRSESKKDKIWPYDKYLSFLIHYSVYSFYFPPFLFLSIRQFITHKSFRNTKISILFFCCPASLKKNRKKAIII